MGRRTAWILTLACAAALAPGAVPAGASQVSESGSLLLIALSLTLSAAQRRAITGVKQVTVTVTDRDVAGLRGSAHATVKIRAVKH